MIHTAGTSGKRVRGKVIAFGAAAGLALVALLPGAWEAAAQTTAGTPPDDDGCVAPQVFDEDEGCVDAVEVTITSDDLTYTVRVYVRKDVRRDLVRVTARIIFSPADFADPTKRAARAAVYAEQLDALVQQYVDEYADEYNVRFRVRDQRGKIHGSKILDEEEEEEVAALTNGRSNIALFQAAEPDEYEVFVLSILNYELTNDAGEFVDAGTALIDFDIDAETLAVAGGDRTRVGAVYYAADSDTWEPLDCTVTGLTVTCALPFAPIRFAPFVLSPLESATVPSPADTGTGVIGTAVPGTSATAMAAVAVAMAGVTAAGLHLATRRVRP